MRHFMQQKKTCSTDQVDYKWEMINKLEFKKVYMAFVKTKNSTF